MVCFKDFILAASSGSVDSDLYRSSSLSTLACAMRNSSIQLQNFNANGQLYVKTVEILIAQSLRRLSFITREMCGPVNTPQLDALSGSIKALKVVKQTIMVANLIYVFISGTDYYAHQEQCSRGCVTALAEAKRATTTVAGGGGPSPQHEHLDYVRPFLPPFLLNLKAAQLGKRSANHLSTSCRFEKRLCSLNASSQTPTPSFLLTVGTPLPIL